MGVPLECNFRGLVLHRHRLHPTCADAASMCTDRRTSCNRFDKKQMQGRGVSQAGKLHSRRTSQYPSSVTWEGWFSTTTDLPPPQPMQQVPAHPGPSPGADLAGSKGWQDRPRAGPARLMPHTTRHTTTAQVANLCPHSCLPKAACCSRPLHAAGCTGEQHACPMQGIHTLG